MTKTKILISFLTQVVSEIFYQLQVIYTGMDALSQRNMKNLQSILFLEKFQNFLIPINICIVVNDFETNTTNNLTMWLELKGEFTGNVNNVLIISYH